MWPFKARVSPAPVPVSLSIPEYITCATDDINEAKSKSSYRGSDIARVEATKLEFDYIRDPICFAGVNWIVALTGANGYDLDGEAGDVKAVEDIFQRMRFESWVKRVTSHLAIYGVTFNEIIPNTEKTIIVGLNPIDPKSMDFSKKPNPAGGEPLLDLDAYGKPKFYVQHPISWDHLTLNQGVQFKPDEILYIPMRMLADSLWGIGILEPIHEITKIKNNVERALGEAIFRVGFPIPIVYCGDDKNPPTPQAVQEMALKLKKFNNQTVVSLPYYNKIDIGSMAGGFTYAIAKACEYYLDQQVAGIGIPKAVLTGIGEGSNRATLEQLTDIGARNIESIHRAIEEALNVMLFKKMRDIGQISGPVTIKFRPLKMEQKFETVDAITALVQAGVLTPEPELEDFVREYMDLPERVGEFQPKEKSPEQFGEQIGKEMFDKIQKEKPY